MHPLASKVLYLLCVKLLMLALLGTYFKAHRFVVDPQVTAKRVFAQL